MDKLFKSKKFISKIVLILVCLIVFQAVAPKTVRAAGDDGGIGGRILRPIISLVLFLSDGVISILQDFVSFGGFEYIDVDDPYATWINPSKIMLGKDWVEDAAATSITATGNASGSVLATIGVDKKNTFLRFFFEG